MIPVHMLANERTPRASPSHGAWARRPARRLMITGRESSSCVHAAVSTRANQHGSTIMMRIILKIITRINMKNAADSAS
jgi:hypothetical protein